MLSKSGVCKAQAYRDYACALKLAFGAAILFSSADVFAQFVDGNGNSVVGPGEVGSNYSCSSGTNTAVCADNPFVSNPQGNGDDPASGDSSSGGSGPYPPYFFVDPNGGATGAEISEVYVRASGVTTIDNRWDVDSPNVAMLEGNRSGIFPVPGSGTTIDNSGSSAYVGLYKNVVQGVTLNNSSGAFMYVQANNANAATISNTFDAFMSVVGNSAVDAQITNADNSTMIVNANNVSGANIHNGASGAGDSSRMLLIHNNADGAKISNDGSGLMAAYGNQARNATVFNGPDATLIVGDCSPEIGCIDSRPTDIVNVAWKNAGVAIASGHIRATDSTIINDPGAKFTARNLSISGGAIQNDGQFRAEGDNEISASFSGNGSLTVYGPGVTNFGSSNTMSGPTFVEGGIFRAGVAGAFSPNSATTVGRQGTLDLNGFSQTVASLSNAGVVNMGTATAPGTKLNVSSNYFSDGGLVNLSTVLNAGGTNAVSDMLVVGSTSVGNGGATGIAVKNANGAGAVTVSNGIPVVQVLNPNASASGAFALSGRVVAGPYEYRLVQGGSAANGGNPSDGNWYLRSEKEPDPPNPPIPPAPPEPPVPPVPPPQPGPAPEPLYRPEVAAYLANQRLVGQMFVHTMHDRMGEPQFSETLSSVRPESRRKAVWLRMTGNWEGSRSQDGNFDVSTDLFLMQAGGELMQWKLFSDTDRLHVGAMLGYGVGNSSATADGNPAKARGRVEGYSTGLYATWFQNDATKLGAYVDTWMQYGWFNNRVDGQQLPRVDYDSRAWSASVETGYAFRLHRDWILEPQAQIIYTHANTDSVTEANGTQIGSASSSGTTTRVGVRTFSTFELGNGRQAQPFATMNWWHTSTDSSISFNQLPVGKLYPKDRYELKLGVHANFTNGWTGWVNVGGSWGAQDYHQYIGRLGVKYVW